MIQPSPQFTIQITLTSEDVQILGKALASAISQEMASRSLNVEPVAAAKRKSEESLRAMAGGKELPKEIGVLLSLREVAKLLNLSERTIWGMQNDGRMPKPIGFGRLRRWRRDEVMAWVNAGCPLAANWTFTPSGHA